MRVEGVKEVEVFSQHKEKEDKREKPSAPQHTSPWEVTLPSFSLSITIGLSITFD
jgi:hypothetical protein